MVWQLMVMRMPMVEALDGSSRIIRNIIANKKHREELREIKTGLNHLEDANTFDICAESEN